MGDWCIGNTAVSKTATPGSIPGSPAARPRVARCLRAHPRPRNAESPCIRELLPWRRPRCRGIIACATTCTGRRHYSDALATAPAALSLALSQITGRSTKQLVTDRVMLEASRLLRFTDRTVGEIAFQTGFGDPLYFSRAFKRHHGEPPTVFRDGSRGLGPVA